MTLSTEERSEFWYLCQIDDPLQVSLFIHKLAQNGQINDKFLEWGEENDTPLHVAAQIGCVQAVELLVSHGADLDVRDDSGLTALQWACEKGHYDLAKLLLTHGANPNTISQGGDSPLSSISEELRDNTGMMKDLIAHGADVNHTYRTGSDLLTWMLELRLLTKAELLLQNGAAITPSVKKYVLSISAREQEVKLMELLRKYGWSDVEYA